MKKRLIIDNFLTNYEITDDGKIYNLKTGRELKGTYKTNEYHSVMLSINGKSRSFLVHRLVALMFCENPNNYPIVDHINRDKYDNRAENLRWVDNKLNSQNVNREKKEINSQFYQGQIDLNEWKVISKAPNYLINKNGIIINKHTRRILKYTDRNGYNRLGLNGVSYVVHRLVWETFNGPISKNQQVDHINGNKKDNRIENLRLTSSSENMKNSYRNGHKNQVKIYQYDEDGNFIQMYNTIREAAKAINGNEVAIKEASLHYYKSKGFYWLREQDKDNILNILSSWVPEGYKIIPSHPTYCINKEGKVFNKRNKNFTPIKYSTVGCFPYVIIKNKHYKIHNLLEETFGTDIALKAL